MPIKTNGINHPALFGRNLDETIQFYTEVLGMRLVLRQPNLDEPRMTHSFFSAGYGAFIAFFVPNEDSGLKLHRREGVGSMQHLAMNLVGPIEGETIRENEGAYNIEDKHVRKAMVTTSSLEFSGHLHKPRYLFNL